MHRHLVGGGDGGRLLRGVGRLVGRLLEEVVLQAVVRRDARLRVVVQHAPHQVLELEVLRDRVAGLGETPPAGAAGLDADDVSQFAAVGRLVLLAVLGLLQHVRAVLQLVEIPRE